MADRTDYYFRQRVTEAELDLAFELLERADRNLAADLGIHGIIIGAEPTPHAPVADLSIDLDAPARAYDRLGQRIFFGTDQTVSCAVDHTGVPTDVPSAGQERWLGVFLRFDRLLSDPRTDGNSQQVFFRRDEFFELRVRQAPLGPVGAAPRVPLQPDELLVCDVRRSAGQTQIVAADIDTSRRQSFVFSQSTAIEIVSALWSVLQPAANTVQAALDAVDAELGGHFTGAARRHPAAHIDYVPHGFLTASNVQDAVDELVGDLAAASGTPGAARVGADAVPGTPHALPAANVAAHLSQLLAWLNQHVAAPAGAHNASAIAAAPHGYVSATSVQAQLQEIVGDLASSASGASGATHIGASDAAGTPNSLAAGTVAEQLVQLLAAINGHAGAAQAHPAQTVTVADAAGQLAAGDVEAALAELVAALARDHFRGNESNPGHHRAIHQPPLGTGRVLLWESHGTGSIRARFRMYADDESVWFVLNAAWDGSAWVRDTNTFFSGGFRFSRFELEILHHAVAGATFTTWSRTWLLEMSGTSNTGFAVTGSARERGRLGMQGSNPHTDSRVISMGGAVTFRARFPAAPSSITLSVSNASPTWSGAPTVWAIDADGFGFTDFQTVPAGGSAWWYGSYDAIG